MRSTHALERLPIEGERRLAHSLSDEAYRRPTYVHYRARWAHVRTFVLGMLLLHLLLLAALLWAVSR